METAVVHMYPDSEDMAADTQVVVGAVEEYSPDLVSHRPNLPEPLDNRVEVLAAKKGGWRSALALAAVDWIASYLSVGLGPSSMAQQKRLHNYDNIARKELTVCRIVNKCEKAYSS